ncbi:putative protein ASPARTIC PROTEASE IN GUARD CELL 1 [Iris pallida]|uniref:Uncharacterized protein n=1 Tax=Iris pallida TaxID=29817 RepID=A0AAX6IEM9_IRIPA|nr:putative protein ASPARTIC PROTEASE IN GUARD CELL 1 [Iris pallida]KAJ6850825.1 putative protein ASPARTIC PROTEASE IN GUARD CELL 1 [Iris pallida]
MRRGRRWPRREPSRGRGGRGLKICSPQGLSSSSEGGSLWSGGGGRGLHSHSPLLVLGRSGRGLAWFLRAKRRRRGLKWWWWWWWSSGRCFWR